MGLFDGIAARLRTNKEAKRLGRLLREVEAPSTVESDVADIEAMMAGHRTKNDALRELTDFLGQREGIAYALSCFPKSGASNAQRLTELYLRLIRDGAGQKIRGIYVATAGIYDPVLLLLLLQKENDVSNTLPLGVIAMRYIEGRNSH